MNTQQKQEIQTALQRCPKGFSRQRKESYYQVKNASSGYTENESVQIYKNDNSANQNHAIYPPLLVIAEQFGASLRLLV